MVRDVKVRVIAKTDKKYADHPLGWGFVFNHNRHDPKHFEYSIKGNPDGTMDGSIDNMYSMSGASWFSGRFTNDINTAIPVKFVKIYIDDKLVYSRIFQRAKTIQFLYNLDNNLSIRNAFNLFRKSR
jgi:hypothetical protein